MHLLRVSHSAKCFSYITSFNLPSVPEREALLAPPKQRGKLSPPVTHSWSVRGSESWSVRCGED